MIRTIDTITITIGLYMVIWCIMMYYDVLWCIMMCMIWRYGYVSSSGKGSIRNLGNNRFENLFSIIISLGLLVDDDDDDDAITPATAGGRGGGRASKQSFSIIRLGGERELVVEEYGLLWGESVCEVCEWGEEGGLRGEIILLVVRVWVVMEDEHESVPVVGIVFTVTVVEKLTRGDGLVEFGRLL